MLSYGDLKMTFLEFLSVYVFGAIGYGSIETLWRGYTHWTMLLTGGLCFCLIHLLATRMHQSLWKTWIMCAAVITTVEFVVGCAVNLKLGWNVWDYSLERFNLMGQICPLFSFFWFLLSIPCVYVSRLLKKYVFVK
jgi:uncharacterized membrane protein